MTNKNIHGADVTGWDKKDLSKKAMAKLQKINPGLPMKVQKMDHFMHSYGVTIHLDSFLSQALTKGKGLNLPEGWSLKDLPRSNNFHLIIPGEGTITWLRLTRKGF